MCSSDLGVLTATITVNTPAINTGAISEGVAVLSQAITLKSATSRLIVRGAIPLFANTDMNAYVMLYTNLSTAYIGIGRSYLSISNKIETPVADSGPFAHGQPAGTVITASMRATRGTATDQIIVNGSAPATPFSNPTKAWLYVEEVV